MGPIQHLQFLNYALGSVGECVSGYATYRAAHHLSDEDFEEFDRRLSSPAFLAADGRVRLPWFAIYFQERYKTTIYALDKNWYDLIRSTPDDGGFGDDDVLELA